MSFMFAKMVMFKGSAQLHSSLFRYSNFDYFLMKVNNNGADQTAQLRRLICAVVVRIHNTRWFSYAVCQLTEWYRI